MHQHITIKDQKIFIEGCDALTLAQTYKTPLYVLSETTIREKFREIRTQFLEKHPNTIAAYASKAFLTTAFVKIVAQEGFHMDVVSGGELFTALNAQFPMERIIFHGNNKSKEELEMAVLNKVGRIVVDNTHELEVLASIAKAHQIEMNILFRITPGVNSSTHDYIATGKKDSKFGISLDDFVIMPAIETAIKAPFLNFLGFHFHVGSQIFDHTSHVVATQIALDLIKRVKADYNYDITELNTGGGFGIKYTDTCTPQSIGYFTDAIVDTIDQYCMANHLVRPKICIEPGRFIVGEAGTTLYTVGSVKDIKDLKTYVAVDGGMTDNIRPALYQAKYTALLANKPLDPAAGEVTLCGKCCESGDLLVEHLPLPKATSGDVVAVFSTGAYNYSMASHYNKHVVPAVVLVSGANAYEIVERETYEDLVRHDVIPPHLNQI
ncbi:diaminopimelate decarboxylase [Fusibacter sp. 3D3]|uniref:diaminopimelate decarboxylase n=1 Tax=Fusibacter sp. 3D3 TaxID=1048380 RepID=UPI000852B2F9|nr:diaminopimelate decarboxylase [Fusibacter sp. 3D3]GAU76388.1 diaminopimelate decarboxylase [Fusibacter sp. 3D3]